MASTLFMETLKGYPSFSNQMPPRLNLTHPKANILIKKDKRACLADFGFSTITGVAARAGAGTSQTSLISNDTLMSFIAGGTRRWMSPELLDQELFGIPQSEGDRPTRQSDCYALGMVIYEVPVRGSPFIVENN
jgi:serine/threonine protein kinase